MKNKILNIKNLSKSYGAFKVTDEITIDLHFDEIHALIGPNGAGKSTLIKQIVGSVKHDIGSIILDQEDITDLTDVQRAKIGISRTFQVSSIIPQFSAIDNIVLSLLDKSSKTFQLFKSIRNNKDLYSNAQKILKEINSNINYPVIALQNQISGKVIIQLSITNEGILKKLSLIQSSGFDILDNEVLRAVSNSDHYPSAPLSLSKKQYSFKLPIKFEI